MSEEITTCILGAKGSGKSVFLASLLNDAKQKTILIDVLGVFNPRNAYKTAVVPNSYYCTDADSFLSNADKFPTNAKIIVDISGYIGNELIDAIDKVCDYLMQNKSKCSLMSDEVADIMPQSGKGSVGFHRLVKNGRNYGIKPIIFATQRPQNVDKSIFDLCDTFYVSSQKAPRTLDYILDVIDQSGNHETKQRIMKLKQREFLRFDGNELSLYKVPNYRYAFVQ